MLILKQQLFQLNYRGMPSSFIYVVLAVGQDPKRTEVIFVRLMPTKLVPNDYRNFQWLFWQIKF